MTSAKPVVALVGGTGAEGRAIARRAAWAGYPTLVGSRDAAAAAAKAASVAESVAAFPAAAPVRGGTNVEVAAAGDLVVLCVPYEAQAAVLVGVRAHLEGKPLVHVVVPVDPARFGVAPALPGGSAAEEAQAVVGGGIPVVAAFHHISAGSMRAVGEPAESDVLVCADDDGARARILTLAADMGFDAFDAGPLANAAVLEGLTVVLLGLNKRLKARHAGVRLTGVPRRAP